MSLLDSRAFCPKNYITSEAESGGGSPSSPARTLWAKLILIFLMPCLPYFKWAESNANEGDHRIFSFDSFAFNSAHVTNGVWTCRYKIIPPGDVLCSFPTFSHDKTLSTKDLTFLFRIFEKSTALTGSLRIAVELTLLQGFFVFLQFLCQLCLFVYALAIRCRTSYFRLTLISLFSAVATTPVCFRPNVLRSNWSALVKIFLNNNWMKATRKCFILTA